jgi:2'-hydroxyisoflavone reductase
VVIDVAAYLPRTVATAVRVLRGAVGRYVFVSTASVYAALAKGVSEDSPLAEIDDETASRFEAMTTQQATAEENFWSAYGGLKARCEAIVQRAFGDKALFVRPGLIVGPHDTTDRFTYWPSRVARGGEVLAPDAPVFPARFVDARDLAAWMLLAIASNMSGVFNVIGAKNVTMGEVLATCRVAAESDASFTWVDEPFLLENKVEPWTELPLWVPRASVAFFESSDDRARSAGLTFRPLEQTVRDVLAWDRTRPPGPRKNGLAPQREAQLLAAFHARQTPAAH